MTSHNLVYLCCCLTCFAAIATAFFEPTINAREFTLFNDVGEAAYNIGLMFYCLTKELVYQYFSASLVYSLMDAGVEIEFIKSNVDIIGNNHIGLHTRRQQTI